MYAEGVLYAEKNFQLEKHPEVEVPNLYIITLMKSFKSRGYVTERFAWRHYYWWEHTGEGVGEGVLVGCLLAKTVLIRTSRDMYCTCYRTYMYSKLYRKDNQGQDTETVQVGILLCCTFGVESVTTWALTPVCNG